MNDQLQGYLTIFIFRLMRVKLRGHWDNARSTLVDEQGCASVDCSSVVLNQPSVQGESLKIPGHLGDVFFCQRPSLSPPRLMPPIIDIAPPSQSATERHRQHRYSRLPTIIVFYDTRRPRRQKKPIHVKPTDKYGNALKESAI
jgi:hypothetical protein